MNNSNGFETVYPFATENVKDCLGRLDLKDKKVLTVGSSLDQLFNAIVLGAKRVAVFDINPYVEDYFLIKRELLLQSDRNDFFEKIIDLDTSKQGFNFSKDVLNKEQIIKSNNYLMNDKNYQYLKDNIDKVEINFLVGDIFNFKESGLQGQYDRIILSNILQYMQYFYCKDIDIYKGLRECFLVWNSYLRNEGILQLLYLYSFSYQDIYDNNGGIAIYDLRKVHQALKGYSLDIEWIDGICDNSKDAVVTYTKKLFKNK